MQIDSNIEINIFLKTFGKNIDGQGPMYLPNSNLVHRTVIEHISHIDIYCKSIL